MFDPNQIKLQLNHSPLANISSTLAKVTEIVLGGRSHGQLDQWNDVLNGLPNCCPSSSEFNEPVIKIGCIEDLDHVNRRKLINGLQQLQPWRKGPFNLFGVTIDSEWRSDLKWARLENQIQCLDGRLVLDVGSSNGYYIYRMLGSGARFVLGVEPSQLFVSQFNSVRKFTPGISATILPLRMDELPMQAMAQFNIGFDTVFSMGILYHRKNQLEHLQALWDCLNPDGELVLETLIVEQNQNLVPKTTYAKMTNVWSIPSQVNLMKMLKQCGFKNISTIDVNRTSVTEQRKTPWMTFESLSDFLDPENSMKTIEGYPSPIRAIVSARK